MYTIAQRDPRLCYKKTKYGIKQRGIFLTASLSMPTLQKGSQPRIRHPAQWLIQPHPCILPQWLLSWGCSFESCRTGLGSCGVHVVLPAVLVCKGHWHRRKQGVRQDKGQPPRAQLVLLAWSLSGHWGCQRQAAFQEGILNRKWTDRGSQGSLTNSRGNTWPTLHLDWKGVKALTRSAAIFSQRWEVILNKV